MTATLAPAERQARPAPLPPAFRFELTKLLTQWRSLRPAPPAGAPGSPADSHPPGAAERPEGPG